MKPKVKRKASYKLLAKDRHGIETQPCCKLIKVNDDWTLLISDNANYDSVSILHSCFFELYNKWPKHEWKGGGRLNDKTVFCIYCKTNGGKEIRSKIKFLLNEP